MLHVTNGDSTVEIMRRADVVGDIVAWRDVLHEGPVPALPPAELRPLRAEALESVTRLLLARREEIRHPDADAAAAVSGAVIGD